MYMVPKFGVEGAAMATAISFIVINIINLIISNIYYRVKQNLLVTIPTIVFTFLFILNYINFI